MNNDLPHQGTRAQENGGEAARRAANAAAAYVLRGRVWLAQYRTTDAGPMQIRSVLPKDRDELAELLRFWTSAGSPVTADLIRVERVRPDGAVEVLREYRRQWERRVPEVAS